MSYTYSILGNFCLKVITGGTPLTSKSEYYEGGTIPWLKTKEVNFSRIYSTESYITEKGLTNSSTKLVPENSVIVAMYGQGDTAGRVAINKIPVTTNQACCNLVIDEEKADYRFIYYVLKDSYKELVSLKNGGAQPNLNTTHVKNLRIPAPQLDIQYRIADILSAYDNLIQNNQKQIKLLEEAAMRLYKEWFVNLRFPGYEKTPFINGVPVGWDNRNLGYYAKVKSGYAFKSSWWKKKGIPVIKIKDIQDNTVNLSQLDCVDSKHEQNAKDFHVISGDLLIAMTGATIGKIAIVPKAGDMLVNQRVGKFFLGENPIEKLPFAYCALQEANRYNWAINLANGSAQPNISAAQIESLSIFHSDKIIDLYNAIMQPYFQSIINLRKLIIEAQLARDKLLPKLMSGEIELQ